MGRGFVAAWIALAACGSPAFEPPVDASCIVPPVAEQCGSTCGNGQIDQCFSLPSSLCAGWPQRVEACDEALPIDCASMGFYGGTADCRLACTTSSDVTCTACAPGIACDAYEPRAYNGLVPSGTRLLLIETDRAVIVENGAVIAEVPVVMDNAVGVPGGWLVASGNASTILSLSIDLDGNIIGNGQLGTTTSPEMAFGPGNRVFLAWNDIDTPQRNVAVALADTNGQVVVTRGNIFNVATTTPARPSVTTDGTSFFVAAARTVARVTPDGTVTTNTAFPAIDDGATAYALITSDGPGGWYFGADETVRHYVAQRFDANGVPTGPVHQFDFNFVIGDVRAYGDDLLLFAMEPRETPRMTLTMRRLTPDGVIDTPREIGRGFFRIFTVRSDANVLVSWLAGDTMRLATITP